MANKPKETFDPLGSPQGPQEPKAPQAPQEKATVLTNQGVKETIVSPIGQKLEKVTIQYPKGFKGKRFYKNGDTPVVSPESAAIMKEQGILK